MFISGQKQRVTEAIKRELRRCSAVEPVIGHLKPVIGHLKAGHRMSRNFIAYAAGDATNAVLAAAGYNFNCLGICESTLTRWVQHGLVAKHAYSGQACLYEPPGTNPPVKHSSRWNRLADRVAVFRQNKQNHHLKLKETQYEAK